MRHKILIILFFIAQCSFGQVRDIDLIIIEYDETGEIYKESVKHFDSVAERLDLHFFNKNFIIPYYLPDSFKNENYKSDTLVIWYNENGEKDFVKNWTNTYIYDSLSRVTSFSFSGCLVCSSMPYNYFVSYNDVGQVTRLENTSKNKNVVEILYSDIGEIGELRFYRLDKLIRVVKVKK